MSFKNTVCFETLKGLTIKDIVINDDNDEILFKTTCGRCFQMFHAQDCCEDVSIEDICGDIEDIKNNPIFLAEEIEFENYDPEGVSAPNPRDDSFTWTFYKLATIKGSLTIRWYGESNGYYSEKVDFIEIKEEI